MLSALPQWMESLDQTDERHEHHLLEVLWVSWGLNRIDSELLRRLLNATDFRARAAAVRVLRYAGHQIEDQADLLLAAADDPYGRVRLEALVAASWLPPEKGIPIVTVASQLPLDKWMMNAAVTALSHLSGEGVQPRSIEEENHSLEEEDLAQYTLGKEIYGRDGYCQTCHGPDGAGLPAAGFPPLAGTDWVLGTTDRLIQVTLDGLVGPLTVLGKEYPGHVPMTPFRNLLSDQEVAAVLTYVRNAFGNEAPVVLSEDVAAVRRPPVAARILYGRRFLPRIV